MLHKNKNILRLGEGVWRWGQVGMWHHCTEWYHWPSYLTSQLSEHVPEWGVDIVLADLFLKHVPYTNVKKSTPSVCVCQFTRHVISFTSSSGVNDTSSSISLKQRNVSRFSITSRVNTHTHVRICYLCIYVSLNIVAHWVSDCFSVKTRRTKSASFPASKVEGTTMYSPGGSRSRVLTSRRLMNVSERAQDELRRKNSFFRWTLGEPRDWPTNEQTNQFKRLSASIECSFTLAFAVQFTLT